MKKFVSILIVLALACGLFACTDTQKGSATLPGTELVSRDNTTRSQTELLDEVWSLIGEYSGSGTIASVKELKGTSKSTITIKYNNAAQEDIRAYASRYFTAEWQEPKYEGDFFCIENSITETLSIRLQYLPKDTENNFEIRITQYN